MATSEAKWTAIDGSRIRYIEAGLRNGPDVLLIPMQPGLASQEAVWSTILTVGRAVAVDLPANADGSSTQDVTASFITKAIDVLRLRHPHLAASNDVRLAALSAALCLPSAIESLIICVDDEAGHPKAWAELVALLPRIMLPILIISTDQPGAGLGLGVSLPRCRVQVLDGASPWSHCAHIVCAWITGGYRSLPLRPAWR